jgi:hypothetical protein
MNAQLRRHWQFRVGLGLVLTTGIFIAGCGSTSVVAAILVTRLRPPSPHSLKV